VQKQAAKLLPINTSASILTSADDAVSLYDGTTGAVWVLTDTKVLVNLAGAAHRAPRSRRLVVLKEITSSRRRLLESFFQRVVTPDQDTRLIEDRSDLVEALTAPNRANLFIGGAVDKEAKAITLIRGNLESLVVPFAWFRKAPGGTRPHFTRFAVIDCGQTVALGKYEASADAILYDHDPGYRREAKKRSLEQDDTFGSALRRLRLLRGLSREDFPGISAKEVARVERGEVEPRPATLKKLAKTLGVEPDEIATY
jgi:hypothetical protein